MVAQNGDGRLRHHVNHSPGLVSRGGGKEVVILGKFEVNDGVAVDRKRQVDLVEVLVGVQETDIAFLVAYSNQTVSVTAGRTERDSAGSTLMTGRHVYIIRSTVKIRGF